MSPRKRYGMKAETVDLSSYLNFPRRVPKEDWWMELAEKVRAYPHGDQRSWGIPFAMSASSARAILVSAGKRPVRIGLNARADYLCILHNWHQLPGSARPEDPQEGLLVAEYELGYSDGSRYAHPVRGRFEVPMAESPGPAWLSVPFTDHAPLEFMQPPQGVRWGHAQQGVRHWGGDPMLYAMPNPHPEKKIESLTIRGLSESPLVVAGLTLYRGSSHPLRHLPRRTYRVDAGKEPARIEKAEVDMGGVVRIEKTAGPRGRAWLASPSVGLVDGADPAPAPEDLIQAYGAPDATLAVTLEGKKKPVAFSLGEAFHQGETTSGGVKLRVLGAKRQWMRVRVIDGATGRPTPARVHFSGARGEYIAPYGHHQQINTNWFEDYGADVVVAGRSYAYVPGEFTTDMPVGPLYCEVYKGFEYEPLRAKLTVKPGADVLEITINRWKDLRKHGWVTADTHVHFISPHSAWLEGQAEGVDVINLLASQWGRLFTNVGDITGRVGIAEDDTIVYVGTENRNHMLGHMSMLGTKGLPVYPMCCGGPGEAWLGDPDFVTLAEWAAENKRKGGVVIRPHYPFCGHTEDPVPIIKGLVDALEINMNRANGFPVQEWYRYLNCGYRVAVCGGTDKMGAYTALGWMRTYARIDTNEPFTYDNWAAAVRAGRTVSTNGPLIDLSVDGRQIGDTIEIRSGSATLEVHASAECFAPIGRLEIVCNGNVVACEESKSGSKSLRAKTRIKLDGSGWIAARCYGRPDSLGAYLGAHTSPVYVKLGGARLFDGPAAEHMLALVEGAIEYLNTIATAFDESSRKRMVRQFREVQAELKGRLLVEAKHTHHHGDGLYHTHGHGVEAGHKHQGAN